MANYVDFYVLVDYDNILRRRVVREDSLEADLDQIVSLLDRETDFFLDVKRSQTLQIRLYGGWFEDSKTTHMCERAKRSVERFRNRMISVNSSISISRYVNFARGIFSLEERSFFATCRKYDLEASVSNDAGACCVEASERFEYIRDYLRNGACPLCGRGIRSPILARGQKMVDTMMTCDLLQLINATSSAVALVSDDDDMLPALFQGAQKRDVFHVCLKGRNSYFERYYKSLAPRLYHKIDF